MIAIREARDATTLGSKAVQLGEALRAGLPVPDGIVLSPKWAEDVVADDEDTLDQLRAYLLVFTTSVAVRSSPIGEDLAGGSAAGQQTSCLDVEANVTNVAAAVGQVWRPGRAVVIQRMVASTVAGTLFGTDPDTGEDVRVIESAWGLGEVVVAKIVTPDRFRVARDGTVLERTPGIKDKLIRRRQGGGTEQIDVERERATALSLDDDQLDALNRLASKCENLYGGEQHLEWAFAGSDLYLLQRRRLTITERRS